MTSALGGSELLGLRERMAARAGALHGGQPSAVLSPTVAYAHPTQFIAAAAQAPPPAQGAVNADGSLPPPAPGTRRVVITTPTSGAGGPQPSPANMSTVQVMSAAAPPPPVESILLNASALQFGAPPQWLHNTSASGAAGPHIVYTTQDPSQQAPPPPPPPPAAPNTSTTTRSIERCRSLKDRIYGRLDRSGGGVEGGMPDPWRGAHPLEAPLVVGGDEPTKDIYAHERPFPVSAVYEVAAVGGGGGMASNGAGGPLISPPLPRLCTADDIIARSRAAQLIDANRPERSREVLLMATECADVVRALQGQVEAEQAVARELRLRNAQLETEVAALRPECQRLEADRQDHMELVRVLEGRLESQRAEYEAAIRSERNAAVVAQQSTAGRLQAEASCAANTASAEASGLRSSIANLQHERERLESLVAELRNQLANNARAVEESTSTAARLTNEVVQAKQQATFISSGYKKQDAELRELRGVLATARAELEQLRGTAAEHGVVVAQLSETRRRLEELGPQIQELPRLRAALETAQSNETKLGADLADRTSQVADLQAVVDDIRSQANAAYLHAKGFADATAAGMHDAAEATEGLAGFAASVAVAAPPRTLMRPMHAAAMQSSLPPLRHYDAAAPPTPHHPFGGFGAQPPPPNHHHILSLAREMEAEEHRAASERRRWQDRLTTEQAQAQAQQASRPRRR